MGPASHPAIGANYNVPPGKDSDFDLTLGNGKLLEKEPSSFLTVAQSFVPIGFKSWPVRLPAG